MTYRSNLLVIYITCAAFEIFGLEKRSGRNQMTYHSTCTLLVTGIYLMCTAFMFTLFLVFFYERLPSLCI
jgi:hypothetical protein